jgi:hypothetical protein
MLHVIRRFPFRRAMFLTFLWLVAACTSNNVNLIHPESGATIECRGSGFGLATAWVQEHIDDCIRRGTSRGYLPSDKLPPEQRLHLERRGY